ncbi:hypothetical protein IMG5_077370 [Ichthyophthirius multifiliis]|uniref:Derlin n=1 Tax=Ichthyophthirius multifiliis TaxID=5932 RepID=G0QQD6_ICHMU|nr:hypothetical protein IMG5_077370 [Ichthyophthirius multifiliis]EGR32571.1 hypothetical protein IMG5_077370 [Ichthyophthirius multifiliis]|eukprot:XP_004036557.1 hypothetical protein IMG5_077370 [Ichthyophthirius multifiliis]
MLQQIITDIPPLTRIMCFLSIILTLLTYIDLVNSYNLYFNFKLITQNYQHLSFYYCKFFYYKLIQNQIKSYRFSRRLEEYSFRGNTIDYFYFVSFASIFGLYNLSDSFLNMILYLWSRKNSNIMVHIFGIIPIQAPYITWFFVFLQIIFQDTIITDLIGILVGHIYYYLTEIYPKLPLSKDVNILQTPQYLYLKLKKKKKKFLKIYLISTRICNLLHLRINQNQELIEEEIQGDENNQDGFFAFGF